MPETAVFQTRDANKKLRTRLIKHPSSTCAAVKSIFATVQVDQSHLRVRYVVSCDKGKIVIPEHTAPARKDGLWKRTCFEAFIADGDGYYEMNFSPSTEWATYHFDGYRTGMKNADFGAPVIKSSATSQHFNLYTEIQFSNALISNTSPWRLGLSAVIQSTDGGMSYWALCHSESAPDFHAPACFALQIP